MKSQETKTEFIKLRAEGKSHAKIAEMLNISKSTSLKWDRELRTQIFELKQAEIAELYESYNMTKQARIKQLGATLEKINATLDNTDFSTIDPVKLLSYKLKYTEALKAEYTGANPYIMLNRADAHNILAALGDLVDRARIGEITTEQAQKESVILGQLLKAYDIVEVKDKLDRLELILEERK